MTAVWILGLSIALQVAAAVLALRLVRITGWHRSWLLIAAALAFMGLRRVITFYRQLTDPSVLPADLSAELVALLISVLMLAGVAAIAPLFRKFKQRGEDLAVLNDRVSVVVDSLDALVYVSDIKTYELLYVNRRARELVGDYAGLPCWRVLQEGQTGPCAFCTNDRLVLPDGTPAPILRWESRNTKDGRWYDCRDRAIRWDHGRLVRLEVATDITERKTMETHIEETRRILETMFDNTHLLLAYMDRSFNFLKVNRTYAEADDRIPEFFLGKNHFDLYPDRENEVLFRRVVETGMPHWEYAKPFTYTHNLERGVSYWDWSLVPIIGPDGLVSSVMLSLLDVSERVAAEEGRLETERRFATLARSSPVGIFESDAMGAFTYVNSRWCEMTGLSAEDALDRGWIEILHPLDRTRVLDAWEAATRGLQPLRIEYRVQRGGGRITWVVEQAALINGANGIPGGYVGTITDITEIKQAEEILNQTVEALAHSKAELERFAHVASHELLQPVVTIEGFARLLQGTLEGRLDMDSQEFLDNISEGAKRIHDMIRELRSYMRVDIDSHPLGQVDCESLVKRVLADLEEPLAASGATVTVDPLPLVLADERQLQVVFRNLVENAIKYRDPVRPLTIQIEMTRAGEEWIVSVSDNGLGIAPEFHVAVFQVFKKLHPVGDYPGTGIGLALCAAIVKRHHGRIWVESQLDAGAKFRFTLPAGH